MDSVFEECYASFFINSFYISVTGLWLVLGVLLSMKSGSHRCEDCSLCLIKPPQECAGSFSDYQAFAAYSIILFAPCKEKIVYILGLKSQYCFHISRSLFDIIWIWTFIFHKCGIYESTWINVMPKYWSVWFLLTEFWRRLNEIPVCNLGVCGINIIWDFSEQICSFFLLLPFPSLGREIVNFSQTMISHNFWDEKKTSS